MKVFELTDVYEDTFDVFDTDGSAGSLVISDSSDGIYVYDVMTPETMLPLVSSDIAQSADLCRYTLDYGQASGYAGKVHIEIDMAAELDGNAFFVAGHLYKVAVFGTVGSLAIEGTEVREFAIAPYGTFNIGFVNGMEIEQTTDPVGDITTIKEQTDAESIRSALGLAASNMDTQFATLRKLLEANQVIDLDVGTLQYIDADDGVTVLLTKHCYTETNGSLVKISAKTDVITSALATEA